MKKNKRKNSRKNKNENILNKNNNLQVEDLGAKEKKVVFFNSGEDIKVNFTNSLLMNFSLFFFILCSLLSGFIFGILAEKLIIAHMNIELSKIIIKGSLFISGIIFLLFSFYLQYLKKTKFKNNTPIKYYFYLSIISGLILSPFIIFYSIIYMPILIYAIIILFMSLFFVSIFIYYLNKYKTFSEFVSILIGITVLIAIALFIIIIIAPVDYSIFNIKLIDIFFKDLLLIFITFILMYFYENLIKCKNESRLALAIGFSIFFDLLMLLSNLIKMILKTIIKAIIISILRKLSGESGNKK